jgi:hypothetical protein
MTGNEFKNCDLVKGLINRALNSDQDDIVEQIKSLVAYSYDSGKIQSLENKSKAKAELSNDVKSILPENFIKTKDCRDIVVFLLRSITKNTTNCVLNMDFEKKFAADVLDVIKTVYTMAFASSLEAAKDEAVKQSLIEERKRILNGIR